MNQTFHFLLQISLGMLLFTGCSSVRKNLAPDGANLVMPEQEFRAAWIASVANINWPSKPGLSVAQQQQEIVQWVELLDSLNFNAIILQVRPQCDALYPSPFEPWSYYLTGHQGQAPEPYYDPLEVWIDQAHQHGLELQVWLNPYRAHHPSAGVPDSSSIIYRHPELCLALSTGYWWMDPALEGTQDHSFKVAMDLVHRYDIDGLHFDDYFYPYPSYHDHQDFPDSSSWNNYLRKGGRLTRGDWRRAAVDAFVKRVYQGIKKLKPHVKFGISPFGIWRPGYPESIKGFDQYDQIYADARKWLQKGWVDYFTPQLYWPVNQIPQSFPVLLGWWKSQNNKGRALWPGINLGIIPGARGVDEIVNQIMISRGMLPNNPGTIHWNAGPLINHDSLAEALIQGPYARRALIPEMTWIKTQDPAPADWTIQLMEGHSIVTWQHAKHREMQYWIIYSKEGDRWKYQIHPAREVSITLPTSYQPGTLGLQMIDRFGRSSAVNWNPKVFTKR